MARSKFIVILLFGLFVSSIGAQDSTQFRQDFDLETVAQHIPLSSGKISINDRRVTDNPFNHMAVFASFNYKASYKESYFVDFRLISEQRGHSGGNNFVGNLVTFPKITLNVEDSIRLFDRKFKIAFKGGDFWDEDWNDNLRIYNIDFNALQLIIGYKDFNFEYSRIADLSFNIGLGLEEYEKLSIRYFNGKTDYAIALETNYRDFDPEVSYNLNGTFNYRLSEASKFVAQANLRLDMDIPIAGYLGYEYKKPSSRIGLYLRYYGDGWNDEYYNPSKIRYLGGFSSPYVGSQLYPLKNYYRPMNQWALFSSMQSSSVFNINLRLFKKMNLNDLFYIIFDSDTNLIRTEQSVEVFPLYDLGLSLEPYESLSFYAGITNKHMKLDSHFQTFYASELPSVKFRIAKRLSGE